MASIFSALDIGYSGLNAAQLGITTTGNNISNASTPGYSRQRVMTEQTTPNRVASLFVGNGTKVQDIARVFNQFVYNGYSSSSAEKSYSDLTQSNLKELSTYFPSLSTSGKNAGIGAELNSYFTLWQSLADNTNSSAIKTSLAQQTKTLTDNIKATQIRVDNLQKSLNEQLKTNIDEVNTLSSQIAELNKQINISEAGTNQQANALRDKRDYLALSLSKLLGTKVMSSQINANTPQGTNIATKGGDITINIAGFNIVDGATFHPLGIDNSNNASGMYNIYYQRQDGVKIQVAHELRGGKIGAILNLRGSTLDSTNGVPSNGIIQGVKNQLNAFANGLIEQTNNLYAQSPSSLMESNALNISTSEPLVNSSLNVKQGSFDIVLYNKAGDIVAKRNIKIDANTTLTSGTNSIASQINASIDDNHDNNANDNINNFISVNYNTSATKQIFSLSFKNSSFSAQGYSFAIQDNLTNSKDFSSGTNFAGALGMSKFLSGTDATNIALSNKFVTNPTLISSHVTPVSGDNQTAKNMVQMQFEQNNYNVDGAIYTDTINGMFGSITTSIGSKANSAISTGTSIDARYHAVQQHYNSISGVNIDQEMTNLLKYQTAYGAAAKVITTIEKMMSTLLSIKQ